MGTRYEDQPVEHWAGPESLDPTPVWKQYLLVALLLFLGLGAILAISVAALAPQFVTPPALVPGDRLVLATSDLQSGNLAMRRYDPYPSDITRAFWLVRVNGAYQAVLERWAPRKAESTCSVAPIGSPGFVATCPDGVIYFFDATGEPRPSTPSGTTRQAPRGLDRYLVSVSGDRVIVNLSRLIEPNERTSAPVPTGIPQPQQP